jgi:hypothetical protein
MYGEVRLPVTGNIVPPDGHPAFNGGFEDARQDHGIAHLHLFGRADVDGKNSHHRGSCIALRCILKAEIAQAWVIIRAAAERPAVFALRFLNGQVIDGRKTDAHQAAFIEFPILVSVGSEPIS